MPSRYFLVFAALSACVAVAAGAFAAHGLSHHVEPRLLKVFETAVRYQMFHALGLFVIGWQHQLNPTRLTLMAGISLIFGTLIFSGSLYLLALTGVSWLGAITPIGGMLFLLGWLSLAMHFYRAKAQ